MDGGVRRLFCVNVHVNVQGYSLLDLGWAVVVDAVKPPIWVD
ncbi:hypothetical protein [Gilvimarinus agarilyticus]|nr:hypothetical protein [Gilvimarinus agarilyticus]